MGQKNLGMKELYNSMDNNRLYGTRKKFINDDTKGPHVANQPVTSRWRSKQAFYRKLRLSKNEKQLIKFYNYLVDKTSY